MTKRFFLPTAVLLLTLLLLPRPSTSIAAPAGAVVSCQPAQPTGQPGEELIVDLYVQDVVDLYGIDLRAAFDPDQLTVVDQNPAQEGVQLEPLSDFLAPDFLLRNTADNTAGTLTYATTQLNPREPVSGAGSVVRITLLPVKAGESTLVFDYTQLAAPQGIPIEHTAVDCPITISNDGPTCPPAPSVWVDPAFGPAQENDGHTWGCDAFAAIQPGIDAVEPDGTVFVASGSYAGALTIDKPLTLHGTTPLPELNAGSTTAVTLTSGPVTLRGFAITTTATAFDLTDAALTAYANHVSAASALALDATSTADLRHNWWSSHATPPAGLDSANWQARLGAPITRWMVGSDTAVLPDSSGAPFELTGGSGTAVLVSHGRATSAADAPFGNDFGGQAAATCSDFIDAFVRDATGSWRLTVPVDAEAAHTGCGSVLDNRAAFTIPSGTDIAASCQPADNPACWQAVDHGRVAIQGNHLRINGLTAAELGGTPFVASAPTESVEPPPTVYSLQLPAVFTPSSSQNQRTHGESTP